MTEPTDRTGPSTEPSTEPSPELVEVGHACFDFARHGDTRRLLAYVAAGVPVDLTDASGNTLVMLAAYHGHADAVLGLAAAGADVDRVNDRGQTPLAGAVFKGEDDVVHALLEQGADPDRGTPSARATAQMFGRTDLIPGG
ncbi:ankyrin repeat domain-containing protein [Pedococcus sp. KACC 23699]|uniref:Ankyrin repeat domain-containing protein n=1 Tax=Pedococcus sp. KACC 23699 TaxID=3149228 RepID=A0AAU7JXI8_9MICO